MRIAKYPDDGLGCTFGEPDSCSAPARWVPEDLLGEDGQMLAGWDGSAWCDLHNPERRWRLASQEIEALRALVRQAHRDSWSDEGEQMWACRGLVALSDEQAEVLQRALARGGQREDG